MKKCEWKGGEYKPCDRMEINLSQTKIIQQSRNHTFVMMGSNEISFCPYCGASLEKPIEIKVGMFGRFRDNSDGNGVWGVLKSIKKKAVEPYQSYTGFGYRYFTPGLPPEFNRDGTPRQE